MVRLRMLVALVIVSLLGSATFADVKTEERTLVQFEGMLGGMARMFGGKAARDGIRASVAVQGDRMARLTGETGEIIDLAEEKVYQLDLKKKTYRVLTFEQMRQQYEAAMKKLQEQTKELEDAKEPDAPEQAPAQEIEIDFTVNETGQRKNVAGHDCREVISTVTMRQKGKTLEEAGGLVLTSTMWVAPTVPAMAEITDFEARYAQKLLGRSSVANARETMAAIAMYPGLQDALSRAAEEASKLDGTALLTVSKVETVASAEQMAQRQQASQDSDQNEPAPTSVGGLGGLLGKKLMKKKAEEPKAQGAPNRTTVMTSTTEYLTISTAVAPGDLAIPAGFRERGQSQ
jgi:hypothetical protein